MYSCETSVVGCGVNLLDDPVDNIRNVFEPYKQRKKAPVVANDTVYILTDNAKLIALR